MNTILQAIQEAQKMGYSVTFVKPNEMEGMRVIMMGVYINVKHGFEISQDVLMALDPELIIVEHFERTFKRITKG